MSKNADLMLSAVLALALPASLVGDQALLDEVAAPKGERQSRLVPSRLQQIEAGARKWVTICLAAEFQPPERARFALVVGSDAGEYVADRAVLCYAADQEAPLDGTVTLWQTRHVLGIEIVQDATHGDLLPRSEIEACIQRMLNLPPGLAFNMQHTETDLSAGMVLVSSPHGANVPGYARSIRWWQGGGRLGLAMLKKAERQNSPSSLTAEAWNLQYNRHWFRNEVSQEGKPKFHDPYIGSRD